MQISLAQEIAKSEEVENAQKRRQLVPGNVLVNLSKGGIKQPPTDGLAAPRLIRALTFPPQERKAQQAGQGEKENASLAARFF